ncbi:hypothetical protein PBY51_010006 [Eleginops maclovinus]|uniref:Uncharacterized protein n=1 Tax=Eleginops maclovinus TaxID=56733 RepID=A0AAN7XSI7_ELEMC|nr:hypothetical protein PBY51_010006 [Eleginops maclovinus]
MLEVDPCATAVDVNTAELPSTPCLIIQGDMMKPSGWLISIEGHVVPLSQSPAVQVESKKLPAASDTTPNESDSADHVGTQVPLSQSPAVQVESKKLPAASDTIPNESDSADHVGTQVPLSQSPAVQVESKKLPAASDTIPNESDSADHVGTQVTAK